MLTNNIRKGLLHSLFRHWTEWQIFIPTIKYLYQVPVLKPYFKGIALDKAQYTTMQEFEKKFPKVYNNETEVYWRLLEVIQQLILDFVINNAVQDNWFESKFSDKDKIQEIYIVKKKSGKKHTVNMIVGVTNYQQNSTGNQTLQKKKCNINTIYFRL